MSAGSRTCKWKRLRNRSPSGIKSGRSKSDLDLSRLPVFVSCFPKNISSRRFNTSCPGTTSKKCVEYLPDQKRGKYPCLTCAGCHFEAVFGKRQTLYFVR